MKADSQTADEGESLHAPASQNDGPAPLHSSFRMAVVGDSISTGAASHPDLLYDSEQVWKIFSGQLQLNVSAAHLDAEHSQPLVHPRVLDLHFRHFADPSGWLSAKALYGLSAHYLNTYTYSWGAQLGARLGLPSERILIAARNGSKAQDVISQLDSVLDAGQGVWPELLFIFFTGNDLCAQNYDELAQAGLETRESLELALQYLTRNGKYPASGLQVFIPQFLSLTQLLTQETILKKKVLAFSEATTCEGLYKNGFARAQNANAPDAAAPAPTIVPNAPNENSAGSPKDPSGIKRWLVEQFMPPNYARMCPTLFHFPVQDPTLVGKISNAVREIRVETENAVRRFQESAAQAKKKSKRPMPEVRILKASAELLFNGEDIANDCFHLSASGQARLADVIHDELIPKAQKE